MSKIFTGSLPSAPPCVTVIMAGGSGTRFWPLSRTGRPKQFLPLAGGELSLLQATAERVTPLCGADGVMVVTAAHQAELVREQLPQAAVLSEPSARNTAACLGYAAIKVLDACGDVPMICLPSDHIVHGAERIQDIYRQAAAIAAEEEVLITIGIRPTAPETGYGYIQCEVPEGTSAESRCPVERFVEKPDRATAEQYVSSGKYFWNSGMFVWRPSVLLAAIKRFLPELHAALEEIGRQFGASDEYQNIEARYSTLQKISVDVGIMEKADNVVMLPGEGFSWSDVGSWSSWSDTRGDSADAQGNVVQGDAIFVSCRNTTIVGDERVIAAVGVDDVIIVDTPDALLVCHRNASQEVREIVEHLKKQQRTELL